MFLKCEQIKNNSHSNKNMYFRYVEKKSSIQFSETSVQLLFALIIFDIHSWEFGFSGWRQILEDGWMLH